MKSISRDSSALTKSLIGTTYSIEGTRVTILEKSGDHPHGSVYICIDAANARHTLKVLESESDSVQQSITAAISVQRQLSSHPNIVKLEGCLSMDKSFKVLNEFCETTLLSELSKSLMRGFTTEKIVDVFSSVLAAVRFMHEQTPPIFHRNIRVEGVVCRNGTWKLAEFGSASSRKYTLSTEEEKEEAIADIKKNTTPANRAPEMVDLSKGVEIGEKSDTWNLGCFLYKLCTCKDPFPGGAAAFITSANYQWKQAWPVDNYLKETVARCLQVDPQKRPSVIQLDTDFRNHFGLKEVSLAKKVKKSDYLSEKDYIKSIIRFQPPLAKDISDESDIDMDEEADIVKGAIFEYDKNEFERLINDNLVEDEISEGQSQEVEFTDDTDLLIDFSEERSVDLTSSNSFRKSSSSVSGQNEYVVQMKSSPYVLKKKIYSTDDDETVKSILNSLSDDPFAPEFILSFVRESGSKGTKILTLATIKNSNIPLNLYLAERQAFSIAFPMFEGNFSISDFTREHKASPPTPGQSPPVTVPVIRKLLSIFEVFLKIFDKNPSQTLADDVVDLYRASCYVIAKLRQFKIEPETVESLRNSLSDNFALVKTALQNARLRTNFPAEEFNFDDYNSLRRLRTPHHKNIYE